MNDSKDVARKEGTVLFWVPCYTRQQEQRESNRCKILVWKEYQARESRKGET